MKKLLNSELNRPDAETLKTLARAPIALILDNVRSLHNIGSIFRTADAFRVDTVFLCGITACPPQREIQKTALGATETVPWKYAQNASTLISQLKSEGWTILAVEQADKSKMLHEFRPESGKKYAFIFGHEVDGVSQDLMDAADDCIEIPQFGSKHSLNVAVSAGMVIWDFFGKTSNR